MEMTATDTSQLVRTISVPIHESKVWLKLLGVLSILSGALTALSIVGIVFAWLPIWMGVLLYQSATLVEQAHVNGDAEVLRQSLAKIKTYFIISGVLALFGMIVFGVLFAFGLLGALLGLLGA